MPKGHYDRQARLRVAQDGSVQVSPVEAVDRPALALVTAPEAVPPEPLATEPTSATVPAGDVPTQFSAPCVRGTVKARLRLMHGGNMLAYERGQTVLVDPLLFQAMVAAKCAVEWSVAA